MRHSLGKLAALLILGAATETRSADWITAPSYYTHDPQTGDRVQQYTPIGPFYTYSSGDYRRSGFRHTRSTIQAGTSADNLHIVDQWGPPVQPYGEWRFPYRPYSVPYPLWGPPYVGPNWGFMPQAGWGAGPQAGWGSAPRAGYPYEAGGPYPPGREYPNEYYNGFPPSRPWEPWYDGSYQTYRSPRLPDSQFFRPPISEPGRPGHAPAPHTD